LADIIRFFLRNLTLIGLITIGFTGLALVYSLTRPANYQQKSVLSIQANPIKLADRTFPAESTAMLNALVTTFLVNQVTNSEQTKAQFDSATQQLTITISANQIDSIKQASGELVPSIKQFLQKTTDQQISAALVSTELEQNRNKQATAEITRQIDTLASNANTQNESVALIARLSALEEQRARLLTSEALRQVDRTYIKAAQESPQAFLDKVISVEVLSQGSIQKLSVQKRSLVLIAITSFIMAVLVAIVREQLVLIGNADAQKTLAAPQNELEDLEESRQP